MYVYLYIYTYTKQTCIRTHIVYTYLCVRLHIHTYARIHWTSSGILRQSQAPLQKHSQPPGGRLTKGLGPEKCFSCGAVAEHTALRDERGTTAGHLRDNCGTTEGIPRKCCGTAAGSLRNQCEILRDHCGTTPGLPRDCCGTTAGHMRDNCVTTRGALRDHRGTSAKPFLPEHRGIIAGLMRDYCASFPGLLWGDENYAPWACL